MKKTNSLEDSKSGESIFFFHQSSSSLIIILDNNGLVSEHIDHWDAASSFFERIPILGWMIKLIRKKIIIFQVKANQLAKKLKLQI